MASERMSCPVDVLQNAAELENLIAAANQVEPNRILEIGSLYGGTLWHWMQAWPGAKIVSIDLVPVDVPQHPIERVWACRKMWKDWTEDSDCELRTLQVPSGNPETVISATNFGPYDFIFVDGGHSYEQVFSDFNHYWPMVRKGGLMAFHDIAYPDNEPGIGVGTWWRQLVASRMYQTEEFIQSPGSWGIGVIHK